MRKIIILLFCLMTYTGIINAQEKPPADNKGKEFWFAFPPNYHNNIDSPSWTADLLYISVAADEPTKVTIDYTDMDGGKHQRILDIQNVDDIETLTLDYRNLELEGWNRSGFELSVNSTLNKNETVVPASFRVTSEKDVSVYIQNQAQMSSDATLVYPVEAIGKNYYVMSYSAGLRAGSMGQSTPSQFVIVGTEDNTIIDIEPPKGNPTQRHGDEPFTIELDRGESYLVQTKPTTSEPYDLTGTHIVASAPVTVIGGHQRAQVPLDPSESSPSRDYLIQQIIPVESWHKSAFVIPFKTVSNGVNNKDLVRVLSASDNNKIYIDGTYKQTINRAEFLELEINQAINITSSAPMQVATYAKTTKMNMSTNIGDPLMMLIHPKEQFYKEYKFINTQTRENGDIVYTRQFVAVILPSSGKASLTLDGLDVSQTGYAPIPNSNYEYKVIEVTDGVHQISCNEDIAIYIYGYGYANSYGYIGGMNFKIFDHKDPVITQNQTCFDANVVVTDTLPYDSGIEYFNIDVENNLTIDQDNKLAPKVIKFDALVDNKFLDADVTYTVRDSMGFGYTKTILLPGFTVSVESQLASTEVYENPHVDSKLFEQHCYDLKLQNYGNHRQEINDIYFKNAGKVQGLETITLPLVLNPGEIKTFPLCFTSDIAWKFEDEIIISNNCLDREIASVSYEFFEDTEVPKTYTEQVDCNQYVNITVTDTTQFDLGIDKVVYTEMENITISQENKSPYYTAQLSVSNTRVPAWYSVTITDKFGNSVTISDTLSPVSLKFVGKVDSETEKEEQYFGEFKIGSIGKDSVYLENYGDYSQTINYAYAVLNRHFSVPRGQFPLVIPAMSTKGIEVIYHPEYVRTERYRDTIIISADCFYEYMPVAADASQIDFEAMSKCDIPLKITSKGVPYELYVSKPTPMPSSDKISISYNANFSSSVSYKIYTNTGALVKDGNLYIAEGDGALDIPIYEIGNGQYLLKINSDVINENFVIIKQR